jgi:hypothetical protein
MKCHAHNTDGCAECRPAIRAAWTAGQLKAALAHIPDNTPLAVNAIDTADPNFADEQVITGAGFGTIDWGDGYGLQPSKVFGLTCEIPEAPLETKPNRPQRQPLRSAPAWQLELEPDPEAEL